MTALEEAQAAMEQATGTGLPYLDYRVLLERPDGLAEYLTHCDLRDARRARATIGHGIELDEEGYVMALCWAYLTRTVTIADSWAEFQDLCAFVLPVAEQTTADPTGTASAGS